MYKLSRFTFYTTNKKNELLLYNTLVGKRSLCKIGPTCSNIIETKEQINNNANMPIVAELLNKGIIVDESANEDDMLLENFLTSISPTDLTLFINPTEQCNFRCKYCYETFEQGRMSDNVQEKIEEFVRQNIHKYTGLNISWFGGEPLLSIDCIRSLSEKFKKICKYYKIPYSASITTNGYLLSKDLFNELLNLDIKRYQITIDGIKEYHDKQRVTKNGTGTYDKIIENLSEIHKCKRRDFEIIIRSNITSKILDRLDEYIETINFICNNDSRFIFDLHKVGNWLGKTNEEILPQLINNTDDLKIIYEGLLHSSFSGRIAFDSFYPGNGSCYAGKRNQFLIRPNGQVHKCTVDFEQEESQVGLLKKGKIELNSKYYNYIINRNNCDMFHDCFYAPICMGMPCPKERNRGCPYIKKYLGISLLILDKNYPLELITQ